MQPRKLALTITDLETGGAERCLVELACRVDRKLFAPRVYVLAPPPPPEDDRLVVRLKEADVPVCFLHATGYRHTARSVTRLATMLREGSVEVLQSFLFHANIVSRLAGRRAGVARVVNGIRVAEHRARWHLRLDRWTQRLVDHYVCVSEAVRQFSIDRGGLPPTKLSVIPNAVDVRTFAEAVPIDVGDLLGQQRAAEVRRLVVYVGRLDYQKGLDRLIASAPSWLAPRSDVQLVLVGDGPQRPQLEEACRDANLRAQVTFAGRRSDVPNILGAADLFVLPSRWEGMPNALLEAMAAGLPVVAADAEGVRETLGDLADRQLVIGWDLEHWSRRIGEMLDEPGTAQTLGEQNRQRAEEFSWARVVERYQHVWGGAAHAEIAEFSEKSS